jgi:hypothetical protein
MVKVAGAPDITVWFAGSFVTAAGQQENREARLGGIGAVVAAEVERQAGIGAQARGFVVSTGSPFPLETDPRNIDALVAVAHSLSAQEPLKAELVKLRYFAGLTAEQADSLFQEIPVIHQKLQTLCDVGLGYLQLGQPATTLVGGRGPEDQAGEGIEQERDGKNGLHPG